MAVELDGNVRMRGDTGPGVRVQVLADKRRLRIVTGNELVGDWTVSDIGISVLQEGFTIKAEGEEFILRTEDDVALADEIGVAAASPRLARRLAARHNPEARSLPAEELPNVPSNLGAVGFAVAGALIVLGGTFLNIDRPGEIATNGFEYWLAFVIGGALMIAVAYVMSIGTRVARILALGVLIGVIVVFGFAVGGSDPDAAELTAYGFIAGGIVVGVAVLVSGAIRQTE